MPKTLYFDPQKFIDEVLKDMKLGESTAVTLLALREEIEVMLIERIVTTIVDNFTEKETDLCEKLLEDHPELKEIDVAMMLAPSLPGIKEKLEKNINSLYFELVHSSKQIKKHLQGNKATDEQKAEVKT